jgi:RNA recognition motif-containing protein
MVVFLPPSVHALALKFRRSRARGSLRRQETIMSQKLFIGGLPFSTSTDELRQLFNEVTGVESVAIATDRDTGRSRGFGFVEMATSEAANEAVRKFNGTTLGGRTLTVEIAKPSAPRSDSGGRRGGGGYRSGGGRW